MYEQVKFTPTELRGDYGKVYIGVYQNTLIIAEERDYSYLVEPSPSAIDAVCNFLKSKIETTAMVA